MAKKKGNDTALVVGGQIERSARSPFMTASVMNIAISTDVNDREIYSIPGSKNKAGEQLFGLARKALDDIKDAAGILIMESRPAPGVPYDPLCLTWQVKGRRDHMDGFVQEETATYTLDLRLPAKFDPDEIPQGGGGRYSELFAGYYDKALEDLRKANKKPWKSGSAGALQKLQLEREAGEEWFIDQKTVAHRMAVREVMRRRPHCTRLAETGAIHALIRNMLGVQHAYTIPQLKRGIKLVRAQQNREALDLLPEEIKVRLLTAQAIDAFGINPETMAALMPQLPSGEVEAEEVEDIVDGEVIDADPAIVATEPAPDELPVDENVVDDEPAKEDNEGMSRAAKPSNGEDEAMDEIAIALAKATNDDWRPGGVIQNRVQVVMKAKEMDASEYEFPMTIGQIRDALIATEAVEAQSDTEEKGGSGPDVDQPEEAQPEPDTL